MSLTFLPASRARFAVSRAFVIRSSASARETLGFVSTGSSSKISSWRGACAAAVVPAWNGGRGGCISTAGGGGGVRSSGSSGKSIPLASRAAVMYLSASRRLFSFTASFSRSSARWLSSSLKVFCNSTTDSCCSADAFWRANISSLIFRISRSRASKATSRSFWSRMSSSSRFASLRSRSAIPFSLEFGPLRLDARLSLLEFGGTRLKLDSEGIHFLLARIQDVFRFLDLQSLGFHRVKESWVWLVARHFRSPPIQGVPHGWCIGRYIRRLPKESGVRTQDIPGGSEAGTSRRLRRAAQSSVSRGGRDWGVTLQRRRPGPLHTFVKVRQTNERHLYGNCRAAVSTPP